MEIIGQDQPALCGKSEAYRVLDRAGLNTPPWMQIDLKDLLRINHGLVHDIHSKTGYIGFRLDKKVNPSKLGRYPHIIRNDLFTVRDLESVHDELQIGLGRDFLRGADYALIINSAFTAYDWHAVVKISSDPEYYHTTSHQEYPLEGEVSLVYDWDNPIPIDGRVIGTCVLRKAMKNWPIQIPRQNRAGTEHVLPGKFDRLIPTLRDMLLRSCIIDRYVECSGVRYGHEYREKEIICWGMR